MLGWTTSIPCTLPNFLEYPAWLHIFSGLPLGGESNMLTFQSTEEGSAMKERTIASRVIAACCAFAATFAAAACAFTTRDAVAAPTTDSASGSIAISYQHKSSDSETGDDSTNFAISDASFNLYKVGQIPASGGATFEPVAPFTDSTAYPVDWSKMTGKDAQVWRDMANTLAGLIAVNKPDATATGVTNASGHLTFTGLSDGLYLAVSDSVDVKVANASGKNQTWTCSSGSMLVAVPEDGVSGGSRVLSIEPKTECVAQPPKTVERTVRKIWNDRNNSDGKRPESITVKLLRDGEPVENVKLDESNKWTHSWTALDADHEWTVVEAAVPDGYTTISDVEGDSTEITNTHTPPTTPDQPHTGADVQQAAWIAVAILGAGLVLLIVAKTALRKRA